MVATEDNAFPGEADTPRDAVYLVAKDRRRHPGVATQVVHLVAGRLDEGDGAVVTSLQQCRLDDQRMGRAH